MQNRHLPKKALDRLQHHVPSRRCNAKVENESLAQYSPAPQGPVVNGIDPVPNVTHLTSTQARMF
jgi:hypothetical protein